MSEIVIGHTQYYSDDEKEFLFAVHNYKLRNKRPFPTLREILFVAQSLGYRKVLDAVDLPVFKSGHVPSQGEIKS